MNALFSRLFRIHLGTSPFLRIVRLCLVIALPILMPLALWSQKTDTAETTLYQFNIPPWGVPAGSLVRDDLGNLYGAMSVGAGIYGFVFELSPPSSVGGQWTPSLLWDFSGNADGWKPNGGLILDSRGNLYGSTQWGGNIQYNCGAAGLVGCGVVFQLTPPANGTGSWTQTVLHSFLGGSDGWQPNGELIFDSRGNLYGTTAFGGDTSECILPFNEGPAAAWSLS